MTGKRARAMDPDLCDDCGHDLAYHRSTGCLYGLGLCPCPHDLRHVTRPPRG
jgi:hypothetical protein